MSRVDSKPVQVVAGQQCGQADPAPVQDKYQQLVGQLGRILFHSSAVQVSPDQLDELVYLSQVLNDVSPTLMVLRQLRAQRAA